MIIEATDDEVREMARLAIIAAEPMGLGYLHYKENIKKEDLKVEIVGNSIYFDYYQGRMVKFYASKINNGRWEFNPALLTEDYQSWCKTFPTWESLLDAAKYVISAESETAVRENENG